MNPDYSLLTTWAQCDAATADVTFELKTFTHADSGLDLADDRAARSQASAAAALAKKDKEIAAAERDAAAPGLTPEEQEDADDALDLLRLQRKKIVKNNRANVGTERFLGSVDAGQVQTQVDYLNTVLAGIAAHRDTLSA
ncbi:hypothetical protein [Hymenobacter cellulosivorans]|uniref:Tail assembly chaperone n=1 Tax=Hymenobacter cellulosivorans TaxID=2932249 RepID=A0ABY4F758_9BACT|nr:hypothetical protein [Hymenobacter cellulosivorans]UOQ52294.1 hypothetical protein MUN80_21350 [Hymenobacter cellulosivorans]